MTRPLVYSAIWEIRLCLEIEKKDSGKTESPPDYRPAALITLFI